MINNTPKELLENTINKIEGAYAPATIRAYRANFERFICFCERNGTSALPAQSDIVTDYVKELSDGRLKSASIRIAIASVSTIHKLNRFSDPTQDPDVKLEMRRMHRKLGRESKQAYGINIETLHKMIEATDESLIGLRDRALILTAYDAMCRRSELTELQIGDVSYGIDGSMRIKLRRSKTDQDGIGRLIYLKSECNAAISKWVNAAQITSGKLFRGINKAGKVKEGLNCCQINRIYKKLAKKSKLEHSSIRMISGHSMRVGAAQDLLTAGTSLAQIMQRGRWSKTDTVMRYIENAAFE